MLDTFHFLGKPAKKLTQILKSVGTLPQDQRPIIGKQVNVVKNEIQDSIEAKLAKLKSIDLEKETAAFHRRPHSHRHHLERQSGINAGRFT